MKITPMTGLVGAIAIITVVSCGKMPTQEIESAKNAIETLKKAEAEYYAKDELQKLQSDFSLALTETNAQKKKLFKRYSKAKELLIAVKTDSDQMSTILAQRKKEFSDLFVTTIAEVYIQGLISSLTCSLLSEFWKMAIDSRYTEIDWAIGKGKEAVEKAGLYKILNEGKEKISADINKIKAPLQNMAKPTSSFLTYMVIIFSYITKLSHQRAPILLLIRA